MQLTQSLWTSSKILIGLLFIVSYRITDFFSHAATNTELQNKNSNMYTCRKFINILLMKKYSRVHTRLMKIQVQIFHHNCCKLENMDQLMNKSRYKSLQSLPFYFDCFRIALFFVAN